MHEQERAQMMTDKLNDIRETAIRLNVSPNSVTTNPKRRKQSES
jgi:hypothetical protein